MYTEQVLPGCQTWLSRRVTVNCGAVGVSMVTALTTCGRVKKKIQTVASNELFEPLSQNPPGQQFQSS